MTLGPSGLDLSKCDGDLAINATGLRCPAWWAVSLAPCYRYSGPRGGQNWQPPGGDGERSQRRRRRGRDVEFRVAFGGRYDSTGALWSTTADTPGERLWLNFLDLQAAIVYDPGGNSAVPSLFTDAAGSTYTADVQVLDLVEGEWEGSTDDAFMRATLQLRVPGGGWVGP